MLTNRLLFFSGILSAALGAGGMFPAIVGWSVRGTWQQGEPAAVAVGLILVLAGLATAIAIFHTLRTFRNFHTLRTLDTSIPAPVRAVMTANLLFLAFCSLELTDGLLYHGGRIFYWTAVLFLPALAVLYGQVLAQPWSWWAARILAALAALWFVAFIAIIPFAHLRGPTGPTPWYGRLYMIGVTLVFASIAAYVFHSLGRSEARRYFGLATAEGIADTNATRKTCSAPVS